MKVAIVGCGFIGETLAKAIQEEMRGHIELVTIYDEVKEKAATLSQKLDQKVEIADNFESIISDTGIDLVVEAASQKAARKLIPQALRAAKQVMIMSVGVLADNEFCKEIKAIAAEKKTKIYIPSGAIGGLDWIKAASRVGLDKVIIITRKPPAALEGSPYVVENKIDLKSIRKPRQIYEGPARDASSSFPANVNVAVALSLAGIGADKTRVRVVADPTIERNIHEISAEGLVGNITIRVENLPAPTNPKTSWVAALSAIQKLKELVEPVSLGT